MFSSNKRRLDKIEMALLFPSLAADEGFERFAEKINDIYKYHTNFEMLLDYLGLHIESGKRRIVKGERPYVNKNKKEKA